MPAGVVRFSGKRLNAAVLAGRGQSLTNDQAEDVLSGDGTVGPAIQRIIAIVTQDKELAIPALEELVFQAGGRESEGSLRQIRLVELLAVHIHRSVRQVNGISGCSNHSFNSEATIQRVSQDDNLGPLGGSEVQHPSV